MLALAIKREQAEKLLEGGSEGEIFIKAHSWCNRGRVMIAEKESSKVVISANIISISKDEETGLYRWRLNNIKDYKSAGYVKEGSRIVVGA